MVLKADKRKELLEQYKEREIIGGVFVIKNMLNDKIFLDSVIDLQGSKNRFQFSQNTGSCVYMKLQSDWNKHGGGQFLFEVLEELKKGETQTVEEFKADVEFLKKIWLDKLSDRDFY